MFATPCNDSALAKTRKCGSNHGTSIQLDNVGNWYLAHQQLGSAKVQGMNVPTSDPAIGSSAIPVTGADASPCKTVAVLQELLTQSIHLRDLYKNARRQFSCIESRDLRQMLDDHYKEQLSVIDVLVDRIRNLGGAARVFAGDFLQRTQFRHSLRGRIAPKRLLHELLEAHESVLDAARPNGSDEDHLWMRDLAVGQVMLTNDVQSWAINERLLGHDPQQRFLQMDAGRVHGCE